MPMPREIERFSPEVEAGIDKRFNTVVGLIDAAGAEASKIQKSGNFAEVQKEAGAGDIVTVGDMAVQEMLLEEMARQFPHDEFDSEELSKSDKSATEGPFKWVLDPIDGTVGYRNNMEEWGISCGIH